MKVGIDIDGVLYPWHYSIYRYFTEYRGYNKSITEFWLQDKHLIDEYHVSIPLCYLDQTPTEDVMTYLPKIAELAEIYYITSRHEDLKWATSKFFDLYQLPFKENIIFSKDKAIFTRMLQLDYFIDDLPANIDSLKDITKAYLFKCTHNYNVRDNYDVVNSMKEFYQILGGKDV